MPITMTNAREFVDRHHSHHDAPSWAENMLMAASVVEYDYSLSCVERVVCVAIGARPRARMLCNGATLEITRVASDRTPHAASKCIAAMTRAALALGYTRLVSYTLLGESGASYRAAGWHVTGVVEPQEWDRPGRAREAAMQPGAKARWETGPYAAREHEASTARVLASAGKVELLPRPPKAMPLFDGVQ